MAKVYITRRENFCAAHRLHSEQLSGEENRKIFGKCNNPNGHGHNYTLKVTVAGEIDPVSGMVMNLTLLKEAIEFLIIEVMDHKHLNIDVPEFKNLNPTAENIAVVIWNLLQNKLPPGLLYEVKLYETEHNSVFYRGE